MLSFSRRVLRYLRDSNLVEAGVLEKAEEVARQGRSVTEFLLEQKAVGELDLLGFLAEKLGYPPIDLDRVDFAPDIAEWMPEDAARAAGCVPLSRMGNVITIAVANPFDVVRHDDLRLSMNCDLRTALALDVQIKRAQERIYHSGESELRDILEEQEQKDGEVEVQAPGADTVTDLEGAISQSEDAPIIKLINAVIYQAIKQKASDIHVEPFEKRVVIRYRLDGDLTEVMSPPKKLQGALTSRLKIMSSLDIAEKRRPQDGKFQVRAEGRHIDFRVSVLPTIWGEKVVLRLLDSTNLMRALDGLGFEPSALQDFRDAIAAPYGMLLVTGPTGSGKTTTLYAALREMLTPDMNFVTVEDPVEYTLDGVNQVQVNVKRGLTFAGALRSILRQDPDIVMIGEIRDTETIDIAVKAALTGHLVLSTLHTNDASSTITRMVDMGVDPFMVSSSTLLVSAQRLMRRLCDHCKEPMQAPPERLLEIGATARDLETYPPTLFRAVGCSRCTGGYAGRFAILETLPVRDEIKRMIIQGKPSLDIHKAAVEGGMITLRRCAILNALRGKSTVDEALRVTLDERRRPVEGEVGPETTTIVERGTSA